jgi:hypothetical protein
MIGAFGFSWAVKGHGRAMGDPLGFLLAPFADHALAPGSVNSISFDYPNGAVSGMSDDLTGDTAEEELLTSGKALSSQNNRIVFQFISLRKNTFGHGGTIPQGGAD